MLSQRNARKIAVPKAPINVRIDPVLLEQIRQLAKEQNRTVSNLVDTALRVYVENSRKAQKSADFSEQ